MPESESGGSPGPATDRHNEPVVDPTENVREMVAAETKRQDDLRAMEAKYTERLQDQAERYEEKLRRAEALRVDSQLALIERQRVEQKADTQKAVDAALAAQKEAVREQTTASDLAIGKSEGAMTRQLDQLGVTFDAAIKGTNSNLGDIKDRLTRIETLRLNGTEVRTEARLNTGMIFGAIGTLVGVIGLIVTIAVLAL